MDNVLSPIKYSFVVPIYNDGILAPEFCKEFNRVFSTWLNIKSISNQVELIFVNDGSPDNSTEILKLLNKDFPFVKVIELSRNFGQHIALTCGYHHSKGEFVGMLNVDMEDPPSEIPNLLSFMIDEKRTLELVGFLRSSFIGMSDKDILELKLNYKKGLKEKNYSIKRARCFLFIVGLNQRLDKKREKSTLQLKSWLCLFYLRFHRIG